MTTTSSASLAARTTPPLLLGRAVHLVERNVLAYRRSWLIFLSGVVEPMFYLLALGVGLGSLVGSVPGPDGTEVSYAVFVAPALLAAAAMNGAVYESTFNIFAKLRFTKLYHAILATPLEPRDLALGELTFSLLRGLAYSVAFLIVAFAGGLVTSPWALLAIPAASLIGFGFAGMGMAATTFMSSWQDFDLVQLVLMPLFLFSATFAPLEVYPAAVQALVVLSPLYHGVSLVRGLMLGVIEPALLGHAAVFVVLGTLGLAIASRRFEGMLKR